MRRVPRSIACVLLIALSACEQTPDVVAYSTTIGRSGAGGAGDGGAGAGGASTAPPSMCGERLFEELSRALRVLSNDCTFDPLNVQTSELLIREIFSQPLPPIEPEDITPDEVCIAIEQQTGISPRARPLHANSLRPLVLCPEYCVALEAWIEAREAVADQCTSNGAP